MNTFLAWLTGGITAPHLAGIIAFTVLLCLGVGGEAWINAWALGLGGLVGLAIPTVSSTKGT